MKENTLTIVGEQWAHYRMSEIRDILERSSMLSAKEPIKQEENKDEPKKRDDKDKDRDKDDRNGGNNSRGGSSNDRGNNNNGDKKKKDQDDSKESHDTFFWGLEAYNRWISKNKMVELFTMCAVMETKHHQQGLNTLPLSLDISNQDG